MSAAMTIASALAAAQAAIGRIEARVLLREVLQQNDAWLLAHGDVALTATQMQQMTAQVARRVAGVPRQFHRGAPHRLGKHVVAEGAKVTVPKRFEIDDRRV